MSSTTTDDNGAAVERFLEFLRFRTISGEGPRTGAYQEAADWLVSRAEALGLRSTVISPVENKPIVIMQWAGTDPALESIVLNSHYDVVPVMDDQWDCDPFGAVRKPNDEGGFDIYGRGTQDMKSVCVQYLEAIDRLQARGIRPARNVWLTYVPDEEIGGVDGMGALLKSAAFEAMKPVGLVLDEGLASTTDQHTVFYGERTPWWVMVQAKGPTGHGSRFIQGTAVSKLVRVANKALQFRREQEEQLSYDCEAGCKHAQAKKLGDVTTLNLTMLKAGVSTDGGTTWALNVIPTEAEAGFDIRISPSMKVADVVAKLDDWTSGEGLSWSVAPGMNVMHEHHITSLDVDESPWAAAFKRGAAKAGISLAPEIFPAATDSRFVRQLGIPALGFSPMKRTPILLHEHNEYIPEAVFTQGIEIYCTIIAELASEAAHAGGAAGAAAAAATAAVDATGAESGSPKSKKAKTGHAFTMAACGPC
eukprot:g3011.t1